MKLSGNSHQMGVLSHFRRWCEIHPYLTLTSVAIAFLALFLNKPFNMDDPLFIWSARQIASHPVDPYGFDVNWYGVTQPMWSVTENPPLTCYYLALASKLVGWNEIGLHTAFLLPAVAAILGTYRLAKMLCDTPMLVALITLGTPCFMVSSTTVMCDMTMLVFWLWSLVFWLEGMNQKRQSYLFCAAVFTALAFLTKYFGFCLVPLMAAHGIIHKRGPRYWFVPLIIPIVAVAIYQMMTTSLYGHGLVSKAAAYATGFKGSGGHSIIPNTIIGMAFSGGCIAVTSFFTPWLWPGQKSRWLIGLTVSVALCVVFRKQVFSNYSPTPQSPWHSLELQLAVWSFGGVCMIALAGGDFLSRRDATALLLFLWVIGTFLFTTFVNWTINGRSILPMTPAVVILATRRLAFIRDEGWQPKTTLALPVVFIGLLGLATARADYLRAIAVRETARLALQKSEKKSDSPGFQGHWGFQYYMERAGANAMNFDDLQLKRGTIFFTPENNTNLRDAPPEVARLVETINVQGPRLLTTMNNSTGAGFYSSSWGPLPFVFGLSPPESVQVFELLVEFSPKAN